MTHTLKNDNKAGLQTLRKNFFRNKLFCSGLGRSHTDSKNSKHRKKYRTINFNYLIELIKSPQQLPKTQAEWAIFSNIHNSHARESNYLKRRALFSALWVDIDSTDNAIQFFEKKFKQLGYYTFIYTTFSATSEKPRYRIILPLREQVDSETYLLLQICFNNLIESWGVNPDQCNKNLNQICFLPNKYNGYYDYRILKNDLTDPDLFIKNHSSNINIKPNKVKENIKLHKKKLDNNTNIYELENSYIRTIILFNKEFDTEKLMLSYGYIFKGHNKWLSPNSISGEAGVFLNDDKSWTSYHSSDIEKGIGQISHDGNNYCFGQAFDLFCFFEHQNNKNEAFKAAGNLIIMPDGKTLTRYNQIQYFKNR